MKLAQTENSKAADHLEKTLNLNDLVCSINRGFSPAGTENWALLKTREEHMLRHSLLRPQMFLNSWFPQVAFPFSPRYCANYFSARSTWVVHGSDCTNSAQSQKHPTQGPLSIRPAVRHIGSSTLWNIRNAYESWWSVFLPFAFAAK